MKQAAQLGLIAFVVTCAVAVQQAATIPFSSEANDAVVPIVRRQVFIAWLGVGITTAVGVAAVEAVSRAAHRRRSRVLEVLLVLFAIPALLVAGFAGVALQGGHFDGMIGLWGPIVGLPLLAGSEIYHRLAARRATRSD